MKHQGRFLKQEKQNSTGKTVLKILIWILAVILLLGCLAAGVLFYLYKSGAHRDSKFINSLLNAPIISSFVNSKLDKVKQAQFEDKGSPEGLEDLIGVFESTEPSTISTEPTETVPETEMSTEPATEPTGPDYGKSGKIVNILLVGQDSRAGEDHKLADTIVLLTLNKETKTLTMTSFLRDSYVKLANYRGHPCGWNRINTAYALGYSWYGDAGAMGMLNETINVNYGIEIDGNVEVNFESFISVIDHLGGLELELSQEEVNYMNGVADVYGTRHLEVGTNVLTGQEALDYSRMRHMNAGDSDIKRAGRQRGVIEKVLNKCKTMSLLELNELLDEILPMVTTNISAEDMKMYISELLPYIFDVEIVSNQCPAEVKGSYWGEMVDLPDGRGGVLKINFYTNKQLLMSICEEAA